jgi:hypothetical protein
LEDHKNIFMSARPSTDDGEDAAAAAAADTTDEDEDPPQQQQQQGKRTADGKKKQKNRIELAVEMDLVLLETNEEDNEDAAES